MDDSHNKLIHVDMPGPQRHILHHIGKDPYVDWVVILIVSTIILLILIVADLSTYFDLNTRLIEAAPVQMNMASTSIDVSLLHQFVSEYGNRATLSSQIPTATVVPSDPSI